MSQRGLPQTAVWGRIPELLAESSKVSQTWGRLAGTLCWDSVALGAGVGLLVGDLSPGRAGCRAGVTPVAVVCLLVCGAGSWILWLQGSGGVQELVFGAIGGWGWVQGILGLGPNH